VKAAGDTMKVLTNTAKLTCKHMLGEVLIARFQDFVTIEGHPVLRRNDPEFSAITGCPNMGPSIEPCALTLPAYKGYSKLVFIEGIPVCLDTITALTDGMPPGTIEYIVRDPGQSFVFISEA
jgi:hypothetical protein